MSGLRDRALAALDAAARAAGAAGTAALAAIVLWVVVSRYGFGSTPRWSEELPRLILVWVAFTGLVSGFARNSHFRAGLLQLVLPEGRARRAVLALAGLATLAFLAVLAVSGWKIAMFTWHHRTTAMALPGGLFYLALPLGAGLSILAIFLRGGRP
ncbi:TRAP transporter small permease [Poseidonocella sp. HB161398]|uniref:TRAP transporter small permease n=1 Tax=Poseidonocella sp. HB161398 TaxID=2320855 RepID=UPI001109DEBC|nr:TRAP transporter small permease [Poseidonocella sp. HB161398]